MDDPLPGQKFIDGAFLLVNKPKSWTSFDVVNKIRSSLKQSLGIKKIKVGHAGTLDPMATGLLIICTGKMTKKLSNYQGLDKTYTGVITLGATTASYDAECEPENVLPLDELTEEDIEEARKSFKNACKVIPGSLQGLPRTPQEPPRAPQDDPKTSPRCLKFHPRCPQDLPKTTPRALKMFPNCPKSLPIVLKTLRKLIFGRLGKVRGSFSCSSDHLRAM